MPFIPSSALLQQPVAAYVYVREEQTSGTGGGAATTGSWQTRVLNTEVSDSDNICALAGNQVTLAAGTYICLIRSPGFQINLHQARLQNITAGTTLLVGGASYTNVGGLATSDCWVMGKFTVAAGQALEVQYQAQSTGGAQGLGVAGSFTTEVHAEAQFWKVA
jgi:hypothetical protein